MEAYFIQVESRYLQDKLYEIVLLNYKEAIFIQKLLVITNFKGRRGLY